MEKLKNAKEVLKNLTVQVGNHTDSRLGRHSYALWTETDDYIVSTKDGREFAYQRYSYKTTTYNKIDVPEKLVGAEILAFENLPASVRTMVVKELFSDFSNNEQILLVYGEKKGQAIIEENEWVAAHLIQGDERLTRNILKEYGRRWEKIEDHNHEFILDTDTLVKTYREEYDSEYHEYYIPYTLHDWHKVSAERKVYQEKVYSLAKSYKMPCRVVRAILGSVVEEKLDEALTKVSEVKKSFISEEDKWELSCGKARRQAVLLKLTGIDFYNKNSNETIAHYLLK